MLFLCGSALIFVSLLVLNLLTGAGAYIRHERDLCALSAVYQIYYYIILYYYIIILYLLYLFIALWLPKYGFNGNGNGKYGFNGK